MQIKKYMPYFNSLIVAMILVFAINAILDWSYNRNKYEIDSVDVESNTKKLRAECNEIHRGFNVSDVGLVLISSNRTTKVTYNSGGGLIKYWNSSNIEKLIPEGGICKVGFDSGGVVTDIAWLE